MITQLLTDKKIAPTPFREEVLRILINSNKPISQRELEENTHLNHDRVTMYRTLKLFVQKGLIHKIPISDNLVAFSYLASKNNSENDHLHFHCTDCDRVYCMHQVAIQNYSLPNGFISTNTNLIVNGICNNCNTKSC